ncbi:DUF2461 domain-containing protein [Fulvivirga sedimenti]|uniref:DUF2461 domain-containing protein n=1 Tax=Fulvivirga sedimenti TaxID=2879465 RepID=A0A9X1HVA5_9BACT|nr:DUF2461 domain-containing protein [Fulvivirga sedimenti]MCA6078561.1 DUF2461 domain-containing protein [Fulvivirga sedimenti]
MKNTLQFLSRLKSNNNREWFEKNKKQYEISNDETKALAASLESLIREFDELEPSGTKIYRIYRDVRFSNDKTPYKITRSMSFTRAGEERRGGYYVQIQPGQSFLATGFWGPEPADLLHIRKQISQDSEQLRKVLDGKSFKSYFGELYGDQLKTAPKGFEKDDPAIDLLRYKQFILTHSFTDEEVLAPNFASLVAAGYKKAMPFLNCMTEMLITDLNGVPLIR